MSLSNATLSNTTIESLEQRGFTRRHLGRMASLLAAGAALPFYNEYAMAQDAERRMQPGMRPVYGPDVVRISSNENPQGPCKEGLEALMKVAPMGWRYQPHNENGELTKAIAETTGVPESYVMATAGSSDPLHRTSCAFTSPTQKLGHGQPGLRRRRTGIHRIEGGAGAVARRLLAQRAGHDSSRSGCGRLLRLQP